LAGHEALVLDTTQTRFVRIPNYPTNASVIHAKRSIELTNQTDALVREEIIFNGIHAGYLREYLRNLLPESRRAYFAGQFIGNAGLLSDLSFEGLEQPHLPLTVKMSYVMRGQFHSLGSQIVGNLPVTVERTFLIQEPVAKRLTPFEVSIPLTIKGSVTVNIPSRFKARPLVQPSVSRENPYVSCSVDSALVGNGWQLNYQISGLTGRRPAAEYDDHCRAMQAAVDSLKPQLIGEQVRR
jgi:hypothetical protein